MAIIPLNRIRAPVDTHKRADAALFLFCSSFVVVRLMWHIFSPAPRWRPAGTVDERGGFRPARPVGGEYAASDFPPPALLARRVKRSFVYAILSLAPNCLRPVLLNEGVLCRCS